MTGRRHSTSPAGVPLRSPAGDVFTPARIEEARRLTAALSIAAELEQHKAVLQLAKQVAADPQLAQVVLVNLALAMSGVARQVNAQQQAG